MARTVGIGIQDFEKIRERNVFYIDKTKFIQQWWESQDDVTLITRPRRFGKTLTIKMMEQFFSVDYQGRGELFEDLYIWENKEYRCLQGSYPVISLSFANVKASSFPEMRKQICQAVTEIYNAYDFLAEGDLLNAKEKDFFEKISVDMEDYAAVSSLRVLSDYLYRYYGKKVIILLDEYDTPMQEAYVNGFWDELISFMRNLFHATFKGNSHLERALMTGITRISKESVFSDLNNLEVVTTTSDKYADCFGFTEEEVFAALNEFGLSDRKEEVKEWYDGFIFGRSPDIYNPWSIINYLDKGRLGAYWANTSSNSMVGKLLREGKAMLLDDRKAMNIYMNRVALATFSFFDSGNRASAESEPERFYHGFVLGLMVGLEQRYAITSNRESGFGRYDVILEPKNYGDDAIILEFKVRDADDEADLSETVQAALEQIERKKYAADLLAKGIPENRIRKYGFAFQGKKVLIG